MRFAPEKTYRAGQICTWCDNVVVCNDATQKSIRISPLPFSLHIIQQPPSPSSLSLTSFPRRICWKSRCPFHLSFLPPQLAFSLSQTLSSATAERRGKGACKFSLLVVGFLFGEREREAVGPCGMAASANPSFSPFPLLRQPPFFMGSLPPPVIVEVVEKIINSSPGPSPPPSRPRASAAAAASRSSPPPTFHCGGPSSLRGVG